LIMMFLPHYIDVWLPLWLIIFVSASPSTASPTSPHEMTLGISNATDMSPEAAVISTDASATDGPIYYPDSNLKYCVELSGGMHFFVVEDSYGFKMRINGEQHCSMSKEGFGKSTGSWYDVPCDEGYTYRTKGDGSEAHATWPGVEWSFTRGGHEFNKERCGVSGPNQMTPIWCTHWTFDQKWGTC
jgi:hypothetical protein